MNNQISAKSNIGGHVVLFTLIRTVINSAYRMVYAMQPLLAASIGVNLGDLAVALSIRSLLGSFSPFLATFTDTYGRKKGMLFGMTLFTLGMGITAVLQSFIGFIIGASLVVVGNGVFIPSMQSYLSDYVPFERRGKILSITELSWSMGFILGAPALGVLLTRIDWIAPHIVLTVIGLLLMLIFWRIIPADTSKKIKQPLLQNLGLALRSAPVLAGVAASISSTGANEVVNMVFSEWIKDSFGLAFATLTIASVVIGGSELASELLSALILDRVSKQKAITVALIINALSSLALPFTKQSLTLTLIALSAIFISFEFFLIGLITLMSEVLPAARASVMAVIIATFSAGRVFGALFGAQLYQISFLAICLTAVALDVFAAFFVQKIYLTESKK